MKPLPAPVALSCTLLAWASMSAGSEGATQVKVEPTSNGIWKLVPPKSFSEKRVMEAAMRLSRLGAGAARVRAERERMRMDFIVGGGGGCFEVAKDGRVERLRMWMSTGGWRAGGLVSCCGGRLDLGRGLLGFLYFLARCAALCSLASSRRIA